MHDRDELNSGWPQKFITIIVPFLEALFIFFPAADKSTTIFHNIISLVAINIHSILHLSKPLAKST